MNSNRNLASARLAIICMSTKLGERCHQKKREKENAISPKTAGFMAKLEMMLIIQADVQP